MSKNTLLIMPSVLKERSGIHTNIDDKLIFPEIKAAQDMHILPLLGSGLFHKIQDEIEAETLSGNYKDLMDDYIIDALCNYVLSELPEGLNYQFWNKGVSTNTDPNSNQPSMSEMYSTMSKSKNRAEHYAKRCRLFLVQNSPAMFPEYSQTASGVDVIAPEGTSFVSPIYLGLQRMEIKPNRDPNYNSNDPFIY